MNIQDKLKYLQMNENLFIPRPSISGSIASTPLAATTKTRSDNNKTTIIDYDKIELYQDVNEDEKIIGSPSSTSSPKLNSKKNVRENSQRKKIKLTNELMLVRENSLLRLQIRDNANELKQSTIGSQSVSLTRTNLEYYLKMLHNNNNNNKNASSFFSKERESTADLDSSSIASSTHFTMINGFGGQNLTKLRGNGKKCCENKVTCIVLTMTVLFLIGIAAAILFIEYPIMMMDKAKDD